MQDSDDLDVLAELAIEDYIPSQAIFIVSLANIVTGTALIRLARQDMKHLIQPGKIAVPLFPASCLLGAAANEADKHLAAAYGSRHARVSRSAVIAGTGNQDCWVLARVGWYTSLAT
jgi:hypothetical protein